MQLKDASFRRQILTQYFILFQFLLNLTSESKGKQAYTGGMPRDFELKEEDIRWIKDKIKAIRGDLVKMPGDGPRFDSILLSIIGHEHFYVSTRRPTVLAHLLGRMEKRGVCRGVFRSPSGRATRI